MQWFKHPNNFRNEPKLRAIEKALGEAGYARALKLFEIIAEQGSVAGKFSPSINLTASHTDIEWLAAALHISVDDLQKTLNTFAVIEFIAPEDWSNRVVRIPQMKNHLDEYTQKQFRPQKSRQTPDRPSKEPQPAPDIQAKKDAAIAADLRLKEKAEGCWKAIGIPPCGSAEFQEIWQDIWNKRTNAEKLFDIMGRCIQVCEGDEVDVAVPSTFRWAWEEVGEKELFEEIEELERHRRVTP